MLLTHAANFCYDSLLAVVYPRACAVCGGSVESRALGVACANCWQQTRILYAGSVDSLQSVLSQMRKEKQSGVIVVTMRALLLHALAAFMREHYAPPFFCSNVNRMSVRSCARNW